MVIDQIVLHDFGVYAGHQQIDLTPPSPQKPIILFGGLNGAGKTTMLDALLLCLFGPVAKCSNRKGLSYPDYLKNCINKHSPYKQSSIGLHFHHITEGAKTHYRLRRTWKMTQAGIKEHFEVHKNEAPAPAIAKNWLQLIEEIIPANIAHLFFFDGEQAERYASVENSSALIKNAVLNLLGLDVVEQLSKDLQTLERRTQIGNLKQTQQQEIGYAEHALADLRTKLTSLRQEKANLQAHMIDRSKSKLATVNEQFRKLGGELYERKTQIEANNQQAANELDDCTRALQELAADCLPLTLVTGLLDNIAQRDVREQEVLAAQNSISAIKQRDTALLKHLRKNNVAPQALGLIKQFAATDLNERSQTAGGKINNQIDMPTRRMLDTLNSTNLALVAKRADALLKNHAALQAKVADASIELANIPEDDLIKDILTQRESLQTEIIAAERKKEVLASEIDRVNRDIERQETELQAKLQAEFEQRVQHDEQNRLLSHATKARETLAKFRHNVIRSHIQNIEALVLESYQGLLRKKSLIDRISIEPDNFGIRLFDPDGRYIAPEQLSAGERQLLAISLLWGMAKSSGRPLPIAIDTPLGRLDASHRTHLVKRYFPHASHQVMLFSTDQELHGPYLKSIKQHIGHSYRLDFNDKIGATHITEGYLPS